MKNLFASTAVLALLSGAASAQEPSVIGDWMVKEGYGIIRIDNCNGKMWGILAWEKAPGTDKENPDPAKKERPLLGTPVLMGLAPMKEAGKWTGEIYNSNNGKNYQATISLANENTLDLEGCLVWPLCQTQQWTRMKSLPANAAPLPPMKSAPAAKQQQSKKGAAAAPAGPSDTCMRVAEETGTAASTSAKK